MADVAEVPVVAEVEEVREVARPEARIRVFDDSEKDQMRVRFYVGKSEMEGLTAANIKMYTNPLILAVWVALASVFVQVMNWWPKPEHGWFGYMSPVPAFVSVWMPVMFGCDWLNREYFFENMNNALRRRDLIKIKDYYARSPSSCLFIIEYGDKFVGFIAVDASPDSTSNEVMVNPDSMAKVSYTKGTSDVAVIRHFFVDTPYRVANMQADLLQFALQQVFTSSPKVKTVKGLETTVVPYSGKALRAEGFKEESVLDTSSNLQILDWTAHVPGYSDEPLDICEQILKAVAEYDGNSVDVIIDSVDILLSDLGSQAKTYKLLSEILTSVKPASTTSRLVLHVLAPCPIIPLLTEVRFSSSLVHLKAYPSVLLTYISTAYFMLPPPHSTPEKFWSVFSPLSERHHECEKLVFGTGGEGSGGSEIVVEVILRNNGGGGRRRGIERVLEGWTTLNATPCTLQDLESLKRLRTKKGVTQEDAPDPTKNVSFNLNLTAEQLQSRSQVPLPYAHEGQPISATPASILYDPDSADDIDDDDPDEDLDL
ncbi:hypothetical protein EUX98_g52 [Antrodiella citrinella]|uniref:Elongator complex protein 5 n=1 Tax=Antrodiella citrinella TaxID=2447956 RepID=A0A4V3XJR6_9APHY|nr:hypothetical protein EUX98_g52 [Antrodiella citrinella]